METQASRPKERIRENILQKVHLHIEFGSNLVDNFGKDLWADRNGHSRPLRPLARSPSGRQSLSRCTVIGTFYTPYHIDIQCSDILNIH